MKAVHIKLNKGDKYLSNKTGNAFMSEIVGEDILLEEVLSVDDEVVSSGRPTDNLMVFWVLSNKTVT